MSGRWWDWMWPMADENRWDRLFAQLDRIEKTLETMMAVNEEILAYSKRIDEATNNIAADIQKILDSPSTVLSDEDRATLEKSVAALEGLAAER